MAITISAFYLKGDINGNIFPLFGGNNTAPVVESGKISFIISSQKLTSYSGQTWTELGDIDNFIRQNSINYLWSNNSLNFYDVWDKWLYLKIEGVESGTPFSWTTSLSTTTNYITHRTPYGPQFYADGSNIVWQGGGIYNNRFPYNANQFDNLAFIESWKFNCVLNVGGVESQHTQNIVSGGGLTIPFSSIPENGNLFVKSVDAELKVTFREDPIIFHQEKKSAIYIREFSATPANFSVNKQIEVYGVHGSLLLGNYIFGSGRSGAANSIVKINIHDHTDISYANILRPGGSKATSLEQIVTDGLYIYMLSGVGLGVNHLIKLNSTDLSYQTFSLPYGVDGIPITKDNDFLYIHQREAPHAVHKYRISDLDPFTDQHNVMPQPVGSIDLDSHVPIGSGNYMHACVVDEYHVYSSITSGSRINEGYFLTKISKDDLSFVSYAIVPRSTDDMTQNDDFIFLGQEVAFDGDFGNDFGAYAYKKSDLSFFPLSYLSNTDYQEINDKAYTSYASLIFGDYLMDFKTNQRIYNIDMLDVDSWSDEIPAKFTRSEYPYTPLVAGGVINEVIFDYDNQVFHGFVWNSQGNSRSDYVKFTLPDLIIITAPVISILPVETISENNFNLKATITSNGGTPITSAYFQVYTTDDVFVENVPITDFANGEKTATYTTTESRKVRFVAINNKGASTSGFTDLIVVTTQYIMQGVVYYGADNIPQSDVNVYLLDTLSGDIVMNTITDENGEYRFVGLTKDKEYFLFGFKENKRIVSKTKIPQEIII